MKKKGGILDNVKLYYERLPSEPKAKRRTSEKPKKKNITELLDADILFRFAIFYPVIFQKRFTNRTAVLSNIDDRKIMPKVPPTSKKRTTKPKRQKVV